MKYEIRAFTKNEVWKDILISYFSYHSKLKHLNYNYKAFIPYSEKLFEMFESENFYKEAFEKMSQNKYNDKQNSLGAYYKNEFNKIYNINTLNKNKDEITKELETILPEISLKLKILKNNWQMFIPESLKIYLSYGNSGSYRSNKDNPRIILRKSRTHNTVKDCIKTSIHELVHICIEEDIIKKYNVPQMIKERIVDNICIKFLKIYEDNQFRFKYPQYIKAKNITDKYITIDAIINDLPKAVENLMKEYNFELQKKHLQNAQNSLI